MSRKPWTDEEIGFLQDHVDWTAPRIAEELGRTPKSVQDARRKLRQGWTGPQNAAWTDEEEAVLYEAAPTESAESLAEQLPGRSVDAIRKWRWKLLGATTGNRPSEIGGRPLVAKTCLTCGLLLAGSWFHSTKRKGSIVWAPHCKKCSSKKSVEWQQENKGRINDRIRKYTERLQSITAERAERAGEPYTEDDYSILADQSLSDFQKALRLKRSLKAVGSARRAAGFKSKPDGLGDPERDVWVIDNPNAMELAS